MSPNRNEIHTTLNKINIFNLSVGKCNQINICQDVKYDEFYNNIIEGIELSNESVVKDLGINVDNTLIW